MNKMIGAVCPQHPQLEGERYILEGRCVGCKKDKNAKHRVSRIDDIRSDTRVRNRERYYNDPAYKSKMIYTARLRKAKMLRAQPKWVDTTALQVLYNEARRTGMTVDHIIPLQHPLVCGLHVPWNLRLLTRQENSSKHNRIEGDI